MKESRKKNKAKYLCDSKEKGTKTASISINTKKMNKISKRLIRLSNIHENAKNMVKKKK